MAEWSIASDLKSDESLQIPWVRIPLSPKFNNLVPNCALKYYKLFCE